MNLFRNRIIDIEMEVALRAGMGPFRAEKTRPQVGAKENFLMCPGRVLP